MFMIGVVIGMWRKWCKYDASLWGAWRQFLCYWRVGLKVKFMLTTIMKQVAISAKKNSNNNTWCVDYESGNKTIFLVEACDDYDVESQGVKGITRRMCFWRSFDDHQICCFFFFFLSQKSLCDDDETCKKIQL